MNRSNPLPIHQFPNLINEVARLKELASNDAPGAFSRYMCEELHAAPALLAVLSGFQEGDADLLENFLMFDMCPDSEYPPDCSMCPIDGQKLCDCLRRMLAAAKTMEAEL